MSPIERFLYQLDLALPRWLWSRRRILAEAEGHLRDAAAQLGEEEAVARFGSPETVAAGFRGGGAAWVAAAALLVVLALPIVGYPLAENTLPPAPWPDRPPQHLHAKQDRAAQLFLLGAAAGLAGTALLARRRRLGLGLLGLSAASLAAMGVVGIVLSLEWADAVPGTPAWHVALAATFLAAALAAAGLLARAVVLASRA